MNGINDHGPVKPGGKPVPPKVKPKPGIGGGRPNSHGPTPLGAKNPKPKPAPIKDKTPPKVNGGMSGGFGMGGGLQHGAQHAGGILKPGDRTPEGTIFAGWQSDPTRPGHYIGMIQTPNGPRPRPHPGAMGDHNSHGPKPVPGAGGKPKPKPAATPFSAPWLQGYAGGGGWMPLAGGGYFNPQTWQSWKPGDPIPGQPGGMAGGSGSQTSGGSFESQVYNQLLKAFGGI
jgi:hypothetical protein